jgi:hypothetical protein
MKGISYKVFIIKHKLKKKQVASRLIRKASYFNHLVSFLAPMSFDLMRFALMRFHFLSFDLTISYFY